MLLSLLNQIAREGQGKVVDNEAVHGAARLATEEVREMLTVLWEKGCTAGARDLYWVLGERGELLAGDANGEEANCLISRGFAVRAANKLKPGCRMLRAHVQSNMPDAGSMTRLFGTWESYRSVIRNVLELRLKQIRVVNNRLHRLVRQSIEDIPDFPDDCLNNLTNIEQLALDLIWEHELGGSKQVPPEVIEYWTRDQRDSEKLVKGMRDADNWRIPSSRWEQVGLLQLLTGSKKGFDSKAKRVSKDTYVLINAIHGFRNRNQHADGQPIQEGVAVAAMMACLELLGCLARELA